MRDPSPHATDPTRTLAQHTQPDHSPPTAHQLDSALLVAESIVVVAKAMRGLMDEVRRFREAIERRLPCGEVDADPDSPAQ